MPKDLVTPDGLVVWTAAHSAYGRVLAVDADDAARQRFGAETARDSGATGTATPIQSPFRLLGQVADEDADLCWTRFRCFDPETGRWLSPDPLGVAGGLNLHGFDGAPTDVVDALGLSGSPHGNGSDQPKFATAEEAAVHAMQQHNAQSISENREYGAWVQRNPDGTYSSRPAVRGEPKGIPNMPAPESSDVAWWHTHGAADPGYDTESFSGASGDKGYSQYYNRPGYLATPSGAMKRYDPSTDSVTNLPTTAPTS